MKSNNLENKTLSDTYWRVQLVCMKVLAHSSLEPPLEYKQDQMPLIKVCYDLFGHLGSYGNTMLQISSRRENSYRDTWVIKIRVNKKGLAYKMLDSQSRGHVFKATGWLQGWLSLSSFHPSEVSKMSTKHFWELSSKK